MGLHLTPTGKKLVRQAEETVTRLEEDATSRLNAAERRTLIQLLRKIYA
jgi:DNA-binding MarR family transcriptional regulator